MTRTDRTFRDDGYWNCNDRSWESTWEHVVNQKYGNRYVQLTQDHRVNHEKLDETLEVTTDYHLLRARYDVPKSTRSDRL